MCARVCKCVFGVHACARACVCVQTLKCGVFFHSRKMIFQCHLTLAVAILIGPALPKVLVEKCYANKPVCEFSGVNGVKNGGQIYCWER